MSRPAIASATWGVYMVLLGLLMGLLPNLFATIFLFAAPLDVWIRIAGLLIAIIGYLYLRAAFGEVRPYFQWTVEARPVVLLACVVLVALGQTQPSLILFGVVDLAGAVWMWWALRSTRAS